MINIQDIRKDYKKEKLRRKDLDQSPFIQFEGNKVNGSNGCNNFFSSITSITKNTITFSAFGETKMMCQDGALLI